MDTEACRADSTEGSAHAHTLPIILLISSYVCNKANYLFVGLFSVCGKVLCEHAQCSRLVVVS